MPNPRRQDRELDALYATLPRLDCQGHCHDSCGPIQMSVRERARIVQRAREPVTCGAGASCSMLDGGRRCRVYDIRPMICRLWGLVKALPCPYGCRPEGGLLSDADGMRLLVEAERIGGSEGDRMLRALEQLSALPDDELLALVAPLVSGSRATVDGRAGALRRGGVHAPFERWWET